MILDRYKDFKLGILHEGFDNISVDFIGVGICEKDDDHKIIDFHDMTINDPTALEILLNNIPGVVDNGIFAFNKPETVLISE